MVSRLEKLGYSARQGARVAFYMGHYFASQRFHKAKGEDDVRREKPREQGPSPERLMRDLATVFSQDLANVEAGHYPMPRDRDGPPLELLRRSRMYFADLPSATERRTERRGDEVYSAELKEKLPAYFLQNFHYQTGGYLTEDSAALYDLQVDVLFSGSTNAMRRQCLVPLAEYMRGRDQRKVKLADIACGTGRFLDAVKQAYPRIQAVASDLSEAYLSEAEEYLEPWSGIDYVPANAETLPFGDGELDVVTCVYLFHEVPPKVRRVIAAEFARVLKPGGRLIFMDSLQLGDTSGYDGMLQTFPLNFHEPYYGTYIKEDLDDIFRTAGLTPVRSQPVFMSKMAVFDKPA